MSREIIRALPLFLNGKKIAAITGGTYELSSGAQMADGAVDGYVGHDDGWPHVKIQPNVIVPVSGYRVATENFLLEGIPIGVSIPVNGRFHQIDCRIVGVSYKWDWKTGSVTGDLSFEGGAPTFAAGGGITVNGKTAATVLDISRPS